jgi:DNA-binding NtrC family response regulator
VQAWQVLRPSAIESRFEAMQHGKTPLVGREEEIALLIRRGDQAKSGDSAVVLIGGEPGIGKSRLAQSIVDGLGGSRSAHKRLTRRPAAPLPASSLP